VKTEREVKVEGVVGQPSECRVWIKERAVE